MEIQDALAKVMDDDAASVIGRTFELMGSAEDEIKRAQRHYPQAKERIWSAFRILCPTSGMSALSEDVYRAHCRELLGKVAGGADTRIGTDAEMLVVLSHASLEAPPTADVAALTYEIFCRVLPNSDPGGPVIHPTYAGALEELDYQIRRRLHDPERQLEIKTPAAA